MIAIVIFARPDLTIARIATSLVGAIALLLGGCASFGPGRLPGDRFDYNLAIAESSKEQMLSNLVRFRYLDLPVFLSVSSVISSYSFEGGVGVEGQAGLSAGLGDTVTGRANLAYSERPTISYAPLSGAEFTRRLLSPVPLEAIFALSQSGWAVDLLLATGINRINGVENMSFAHVPAPGDVDLERQIAEDLEKLRRFQRVVSILLALAEQELFELHGGEEGAPELTFVFSADIPARYRPLVDELKATLGLDPRRDEFRVTSRMTRRHEDEVTIQPRSLLAIMSFVAKGVRIPDEHAEAGWVVAFPEALDEAGRTLIPLEIRAQREPPDRAFVAARYRDYWFYIDQADLQSKRTFLLILVLFELQAPAGSGVGPVLTLPAGS